MVINEKELLFIQKHYIKSLSYYSLFLKVDKIRKSYKINIHHFTNFLSLVIKINLIK
jgi:hypothetical protein